MRTTESETVPRVERESAKLDVEESTLSIERSNAALVSARLEGEAELELLRLEAERTHRQVGTVEDLLDDAVLRAPSPGLVILPEIWKGGSRGPISVGDTVWPGATIVQLPDLSQMEVEAWVHEVDAARVAVGQDCSVVIDAYPEPAHPCAVKKVADLAVRRDRNKKIKHLKVVLELDATTAVMKPGMTVRNELVLDSRADELSIPMEAVFYAGDEAYVWIASLRGFSKQPVSVGIHNDTHVVVEEGLSEGDVVALIDPERAAAGDVPGPGRPAQDGTSRPDAS